MTSLDLASLTQRLAALTAEIDTLTDEVHVHVSEARTHWAGEQDRLHLIDQFIDPQLSLAGALIQMIESQHRIQERLLSMEMTLWQLARPSAGETPPAPPDEAD